MVKIKNKIPAFTIIESLVALIITMLVFGLCLLIFINVTKTSDISRRTKAFFILKEYRNKTKSNKDYLDNTFFVDGFRIEKKLMNYHETKDLYQLSLIAFDRTDKKLAEINELLFLDENVDLNRH